MSPGERVTQKGKHLYFQHHKSIKRTYKKSNIKIKMLERELQKGTWKSNTRFPCELMPRMIKATSDPGT